MLPQQYCLRWKYHHSNLQTMFSQLLDRGCFCDVTLACEGQLIRAHRVVLCACSTFFDTVLTNYASERDPIIIMKDVTFADIKCLIEFMYKGEINVEHTNLASLLKTADDLKIKGLAEVTWRDDEDGPPPPPAQTEFHSPPLLRSRETAHYDPYGHEAAMRSQTPELLERNNKTPSPRSGSARMPTLTPIATSSAAVSIVAAVSPNDAYLGPKRKRGRPPLDDAYDVFNVRKYADQGDHHHQSSFMDGSQYTRDDTPLNNNNHHHVTTQHSRPNSPSAAEVYQHHVQQQKHRMRYKQPMLQEKEYNNEEESVAEPEWITSSMEVDTVAAKDPLKHDDDDPDDDIKILHNEHSEENSIKKSEKRLKDSAAEHPKVKALKRKSSKEENSTSSSSSASAQQRPKRSETPDEFLAEDSTAVPKTVEDIECKQQQQQQQQQQQSKQQSNKEKQSAAASTSAAAANNTSISSTATSSSSASSPSASTSTSSPPSTSAAHNNKTSSSSSSSSSSREGGGGHRESHHHGTSASGAAGTSSNNNNNHHGHVPPPPPPLHHPHSHHHYGKFVPDGYLINEHGILMTHDFIHAPTATIPTSSSAAAASNGNHSAADDYGDIKLEEFSEAELRLTTEEMSQWQDVIKMDDYLAKGRRPQFWEEPFTRRVLDAIKNKRLEMKKAARILGVSYGTLYGRYREVYGCLKHPYSSSSMRPTQASALQHRFDIVWPAPKPGQLDIGKLRPKDLSELWTRPQI